MAKLKARSILQRQLDARARLWPHLVDKMLWSIGNDGWSAVPRVMPLMMSIMDDISGKGFPISRAYFELWSRLREEGFVTLNRPEEMAFHAGFEGQRALRTWKDRVRRMADAGFVELQGGPLGELSYAVFYNPFHVIKRAYQKGLVQENKWQALVVRANEIGAFDLDDIDEAGNLALDEEVTDDGTDGEAQAQSPTSPQKQKSTTSKNKSRAFVRLKQRA